MIVELATGKVYCGETEQSYSDRWHGHVCTVGRYQRNQNVGTDQMYKRLARRGMQGYIFLPWREVSIGGKETRRRLEKMIIYQFPATLNDEFHRHQHGLSDTRKSGVIKGKGRKRKNKQHCRSKEERGILDARLTEYSVEGTAVTGGALDLLATKLKDNVTILINRQTVDLTDFRALKNTFGNSRVKIIRETQLLAEGVLKDREVRTALKRGNRMEIAEWVDGVAVRNANAAGGHADLRELKIKSGSFSCWMKAGREGPLGEERKQRVIDMWEAFNAQQLMMKVGELEHVRKRLKMVSKKMLGFAAPGTLTCCVQRHHRINTIEMQKVIREMLECTEVPKALRRHMYDQIRIVQRKRQTVGGGLATQSKFAAEAQYNTEPECTCSAAGSEFTRIGEHVCMRGREYKGKNTVYRKVLRANAGDNVHPAQCDFKLATI